jgi:hypothetical protein
MYVTWILCFSFRFLSVICADVYIHRNGVEVTFVTLIRYVHSSSPVWGFSCFSSGAPDKYGDSATIMTRPLPSRSFIFILPFGSIQDVPGRKVNILGGHSIGHSKQKSVYVHVSYSERFPRYSCFTVQFQNCWKQSDNTGICPSDKVGTVYPV